jgi:tetratricopeptide (TPR) repeat protein
MRPSKPLYLALSLAAFVAAPAVAQQSGGSGSTYPAACEASKVSKSDVDRAHTVYLSGKQYLDEANYDKAVSYFKDAYSIDCSVHGILLAIASAYERKGDKAEAVHALEEYQRRAPNASDHDSNERRIHNLKDQMAREQPAAAATTTAPAATTTASGAPTAPAAPTATTAPTTTASPTGNPGPASSEQAGGHSVAPWILVGGGAVVAVAGVILLSLGSGEVSSAENACGGTNHVCGNPADASKGNDGRTLETVGVIGLAVGGAAVVGGLVWHFTEPTSKPVAGALHVTPVFSPAAAGKGDFTGLSVSGAF